MGIPAGIPGRVGLIYFLKRKKSRLKSTNSQKIKTTLPIMVRYPFDVLRAVSPSTLLRTLRVSKGQVEPLTMIGNAVRPEVYPPDLLWVYPPSAAPEATRVSEGQRRQMDPFTTSSKSHHRIFRTSSSLGRNPVDVFIRVFHIARLAVDTVREVELHLALPCFLVHFHFIHMGRAEAHTGVLEFLGASVVARFQIQDF
jgi:hypothetical protein